MGQSTSSKTALPANNLLIDASDSYVTEVKLRSTGIIPISEYIKKDKYTKNKQRLQKKNNAVEEEKGGKSKDKEETSNKLFTIKEEKSDKSIKQGATTQETSIETVKKEKKLFIESSFEDIPSKRKWVNVNNSKSKIQPSQSKSNVKNHLKNQKTQTIKKEEKVPAKNVNEVHGIRSTSSEEIRQLYKNRVYPHIYKNKYNRKCEQKQKVKRKEKPAVPSESQICFSDTEIRKKANQKPNRKTKFEESTHQLNQHHYHRAKPKLVKPKQKLSVQTNVACVIHPDRRKQIYLASSEETLRRRPPPKICFTPVESSSYYTSPRDARTQTAPIQFQSKCDTGTDTIDKVTKEHRKFLSARQALENWKNIHTLKQHRKNSNTSNFTYQENKYNNRPPYGERNEEYFPSRKVRSRAGNREDDPNCSQKFTPLELSNYNYCKQPTNVKIGGISPKEIKERNERMMRSYYMPEYNRPESPRHEYIENTSYRPYSAGPNRYQNYEDEKNYYRKNLRPLFSEREERAMDREDFIEDMERCLQKKIDVVYSGRHPVSVPNKMTWIQDKYRRWHKVSM